MKTLYAKQKVLKIEDHYPITDEAEKAVYQVDQKWKFLGYEVRVSRPDGAPVFELEQDLLHFFPTFHVDFHDGKTMAVKSRLSFLKKKIDIDYNGEALTLRGNIWDWDFAITDEDGREVASINKKILAWGDTFTLEILDEAYSEVAVAMVIVVDRLIDLEQANNS